MNELLIAGLTDVGQRRKDNQDTFICTPLWSEASALLVVIDGVGGYAGGERAAAIAKESIERYMATPNGDPLSMLREAVVFANNQINDQRQQDLKLAQMCCVLTAALADIRTGKVYFVHVGDTRLYRFRQGELTKLTHDHSMVGVREDANELTEAEAMQHPRRNEILREVGSAAHRVDDADFLESDETSFLPGDQLLLCSDGLTDMITQAQIKAVLSRPVSLDKQLSELVRLANQQGGNDNITVVLASGKSPNGQVSEPLVPARSARKSRPSVTTETIVADSPAPVSPEPVKRSSAGRWVAMVVVLLCLVAGLYWYQSWPSGNGARQPDSLSTAQSSSDSAIAIAPGDSHLDSLVRSAHRNPDHRLLLTDDTLRLDSFITLSDSLLALTGGSRLTVIAPRDSASATLALRIEHKGTVYLENLIFSGFRTGIETSGATTLQLKNVYFKRVGTTVRAEIQQDTCLNTVMTIAIQKQPVSPKPIHP